jgi:hypothetical protein
LESFGWKALLSLGRVFFGGLPVTVWGDGQTRKGSTTTQAEFQKIYKSTFQQRNQATNPTQPTRKDGNANSK